MALKVNRIIEDLSDSNVEIQILALTTVPRLSPDITIEPSEMVALNSQLASLASVDNPDVVFLARKAQNFLMNRGRAPSPPAVAASGVLGGAATPGVSATPGGPPRSCLPPTTGVFSMSRVSQTPARPPTSEAPKEPPPSTDRPASRPEQEKEPAAEEKPETPPPSDLPPPSPPSPPATRTTKETAGPTAAELVAELRSQTDPGKIASVLTSLRQLKDPNVLPDVEVFLNHSDARVRANAVEVYEDAGDFRTISLLLPMLKDENNRVRSNAAKALGRYGIPEVTHCLEEMIRSDQVRMRESALYAITCLKDLKVFPLMAPLTNDPYDGIRSRLVAFLESSQTPWAEELLKRMVSDKDAKIRDRAVSALVTRGVAVEDLLSQAIQSAQDVVTAQAELVSPDTKHAEPDPLLDTAVERSFRATLSQILKDLKSQVRKTHAACTLFQAGVIGYGLCRNGEIKEAEARTLFYEVEQYQEFLRDYSRKLTSQGKDLSQLQVQIVTTGLAQYQGRLKVSLVKLGRIVVSLIQTGDLKAPPELREAVQQLA